ncbi:OmpA family protein [Spongiibacter nanhainus]|uniref:OmpA family protein n=1 Tax=Spongiibacter nanhainus TaxID=2794344 RepID=A0A7T4QY61_9GAMM|nr:OmpA family protein [Spongiibacter nanhainus]QQD16974.1 OmpA family protein [Spongiibacter nanhainus]
MKMRHPTFARTLMATAVASQLALAPITANAASSLKLLGITLFVLPESNAKNPSILSPITDPLGQSLSPLVDMLDENLNVVTDAVDDQLGVPLLDALSPITEPLTTAIEPITDPVDGIVHEVTGGEVSDALTNSDDNTKDGDGIVNDILGDTAAESRGGEDGIEISPLAPITGPLGESLKPLVDAIDLGLDPLTDVVDDQLVEPILDAVAPLTDPVLEAIEPLTNPVDGLVADLTGGSLEDSLTNIDDNTKDGNGLVNDLLGGETANNDSGLESGETSALEPITKPLGEGLAPLVDWLDTELDPITDAIDDQVGETLLGGLEPVLFPVLNELSPVTDPIDGIVEDVTGGSLEDALTNDDDNTKDGDGIVNDLLGGDQVADSGTEDGEMSPLPLITEPLGEALEELVDAVDTGLDPLTDVVDDELVEPILDGVEPVLDPALAALEGVTDPVDGIVEDLTGGSLEDALTNNDDNVDDGNGLVNDLLGGGDEENLASGTEEGESSALEPITAQLGDSIAPLIDAVDETLDPVTDAIDDEIGETLISGLDPVLNPVLEAAEPVTDPVDGILADVTGGSLEDALSNDDDNTADGDGIVNDLLGADQVAGSGTEAGETSPLGGLTDPLGEAVAPLIDSVDDGAAPLTDAADAGVEQVLAAAEPVVGPITNAVEPVTDPVDGLISDVTGGSLEDALTTNDDNAADGSGLVNDVLGGGNGGLQLAFNNGSDNPALIALLDPNLAAEGRCEDSDGDGVCNSQDSCADTPVGKAVLPNGCHLGTIQPLRLEGVFFEFDSATLTPNAERILDQVSLMIQQSTVARFEIAGHTDAKGEETYNQSLSQQRSESVKRYLSEKGIAAERLQAKGYGESMPLADNDTDAGRAENRRVELKVIEQ